MLWDIFLESNPPRRYLSGQIIYLQGTEARCFFYLARGAVRSFISSPEGEERVLTVHRAGDLMGEASFFDQCPRVSSGMAVEESLVAAIDQARLDEVLRREPGLALPMLRYLARTVHLLSDHLDSAALPAPRRVARYLLSLPGAIEGQPLRCTHEEIGQATGLSRVTVSRVLGAWAKAGRVRCGYGVVTVVDPARLGE